MNAGAKDNSLFYRVWVSGYYNPLTLARVLFVLLRLHENFSIFRRFLERFFLFFTELSFQKRDVLSS